jgi:Uma2 family endonuclease
MTASPPTLMTAEELLHLREDEYQFELDEGRLVRTRLSFSVPAMVAASFGRLVGTFVSDNGLGLCGGADWGFNLASEPDIVRAPDFAFVRSERIPPGGIPRGFWPGAPDLAIEVLSPDHRYVEIARKVQQYLDAGTRLIWIVEPEDRSVAIHRPGSAMIVFGEDGTIDGEDVLPGFTLRLPDIWV